MMRIRAIAPVLLVAAACTSGPAHDPAADAAAVRAATDAYAAAIRSNDRAAITGFWAQDAVFIGPGQPTIRGWTALDSLVGSHLAAMRITAASIRVDEVAVSGDLAVSFGTYQESFALPNDSTLSLTGRYVFVWRRQADESWKVSHGIGTDAGTS